MKTQQTKQGVYDEKSRTFIKPSGTVKQGRRPMFKPFDNDDDTCPKCGSSTCTHIWELPARTETGKAQHSPLPWSEEGGIITAGISPGQPYIADCRFGPAGHRNANAKLIVRAVNHADKLAEALREATQWFIEGERRKGIPDPRWIIAGIDALAAYEKGAQ